MEELVGFKSHLFKSSGAVRLIWQDEKYIGEMYLNVVCYLLGNSPGVWIFYADVSEHCMFHLHRRIGMKAWPLANLVNLFNTSLRKGDSHLKHNSLTSTIRWLNTTRALSPSHTCPFPPCGSLHSTTCFCTRTRHYPVTLLPIGSGYFRAKPLHVFSNLVILLTYTPMKVEQTECSETSAYKIQTPGNYPEENIQHSEHGESLKSKIYLHF